MIKRPGSSVMRKAPFSHPRNPRLKFAAVESAFGRRANVIVRGKRPRLHRHRLIRVHSCPSVVVPSRSCSETPIGLVLNRRPGSSGRLNARFLIRVIREIRGKNRAAFRNILPPSPGLRRTSRLSWFQKNPRRAAAATPSPADPGQSVSIRGCSLAELFRNAYRPQG